MDPRKLYGNCVNWSPSEMPALKCLIEKGEDIDRAAFLRLVNPSDMALVEQSLGYGKMGIKMEEDWHVQYQRDPETGVPFFIHSGTEYVFASREDIDQLMELAETELDHLAADPFEAAFETEPSL